MAMRRPKLSVIVGWLLLAIGCGGAPSSPSAVSTTAATTTAQTAVSSAVTQALSQTAILAPTSGDVQNGLTIQCPEGGTMTLTFSANLPPGPSGTISTTSRTEFSACRFMSVTINGDPYLQMASEHTLVISNGGPISSSTGTTHTTGGLRFESSGIQGRAQYDCTQTISIQYNGGNTPLVSFASSGSITWEQPLGSAPRSMPCGPDR